MNILPKKRWHVRTKDNVARVKRDEKEAAEREKAEMERAALAEQEFRTSLLRRKAAQRQKETLELPPDERDTQQEPGPSDQPDAQLFATDDAGCRKKQSQPDVDLTDARGHVNFFADLERQARTFGGSSEHKKEETAEKEAYERKMGILKYIDEGVNNKPWYEKLARQKRECATRRSDFPQFVVSRQNNEAIVAAQKVDNVAAKDASTMGEQRKAKKNKRDKKRHRKRERSESRHKHKKRRKRHSSRSSSPSDNSKSPTAARLSSSALDRLRVERLRREADERVKAQQLMRRMRGEPEETPKQASVPSSFKQRYNSQFNPEFARQNQLSDRV